MTQRYIARMAIMIIDFVGISKDSEAIAAQRPAMIAHLDEVRGFMEELSPALGVTDPVSKVEILFLKLVIMIDSRFAQCSIQQVFISRSLTQF